MPGPGSQKIEIWERVDLAGEGDGVAVRPTLRQTMSGRRFKEKIGLVLGLLSGILGLRFEGNPFGITSSAALRAAGM